MTATARQEGRSFDGVDLRAIGRHLRLLRNSRNWSLRDLSSASGVSLAAIRNIEAGTSNPSLPTILAVVEALGEPIDDVIRAARRHRDQIIVSRTADNERIGATGEGSVRDLTAHLHDSAMHAEIVTLEPGTPLGWNSSNRHPLFGFVLEGTITLCHGDEVRTCDRGDAFHLIDAARSELRAASPMEARLILIRDVGRSGDKGKAGIAG